MKTLRHPWFCLTVALGSVPLAMSASAAAPPTDAGSPLAPVVDPGDWKCALCPFVRGAAGAAELGVEGAAGGNATYGRYTGIDRGGAFAIADASGAARGSEGDYVNYDLRQLGLASRDGTVEGGRIGSYDLRISYDGQPNRLYDTTATPFATRGANLALPATWVAGGSTSGMSTLASSLARADLGDQRRTVALLGRYFASPAWTVFGEFRRQEKDGTLPTSAAFLTEAVQLPQPVSYVTDSFEAGVAWAGAAARFRLSFTGSWFEDRNEGLLFANPYLSLVPGSVAGQLGTPPDNRLQQLAAAGEFSLPWYVTTLTYGASYGTLRQDQAFLPVSTLSTATLPGSGSLDGNVHLIHYVLGLASRPLSRLSLRGTASYDERLDDTAPLAVTYVVTDTYPGGTALTPRYSETRLRLDGSADYAAGRRLRIGVGGQYLDTQYTPDQVITNTRNATSWVRVGFNPTAALLFTVKYGNALRKSGPFDAAALPYGENPLVRDYTQAGRDRVFSTVSGSWIVTPTLTWTGEWFQARDDYRSSALGLQAVHEQRYASTLNFTPRESLSAYVTAGYERLATLQNGFLGNYTAPWLATDTQRFWNVDAGGRWVPQERWTLSIDYLLAPSYEDNDSAVAGLAQAFPQSWTRLESKRLDVAYRWTAALQLHLRFTRETYNSSDWALGGVQPATVPNLLALGMQPWRDNVYLAGLSFRYQFGTER